MAFEDLAEKLQDFLNAAIAAGAYDPTAKTFTTAVAGALAVTGNVDVGGTFGCDGVAAFDTTVTVGGELGAAAVESEGGIGFFGTEPPGAAASITGALSTVADAPAKAVLTSLKAALVASGQATDGTT